MKLRDAWTEWTETTKMTWKKHLQNFIDEYEEHGDFVEARGAHHTPRYHTLWKVRDYTPEDYDEPVRSQIIKLRDAWIGTYVPDVPDVSDEEDFEKYFVAQANESLHL